MCLCKTKNFYISLKLEIDCNFELQRLEYNTKMHTHYMLLGLLSPYRASYQRILQNDITHCS